MGLFAVCPIVQAWNSTGHEAIALIAYDRLSAKEKDAIELILKAHPHYELLLTAGAPEGMELRRWVFARAATWPDMVRPTRGPAKKPEEITKYDHSTWHYVNTPYLWPSDKAALGNAAHPSGGEIIAEIAANEAILKSSSTSLADKAVALCWVLHLVGDIHQPLHAAKMYSQQFPKGDSGGNALAVRKGNTVTNLHAFWDDLFGTSTSIKGIEEVATRIAHDQIDPKALERKLPELKPDKTPESWAQESYTDAIKYAYLNGSLKFGSWDKWSGHEHHGLKLEDIPALDPDYIIDARGVAQRRAALAGVRLARELDAVLK